MVRKQAALYVNSFNVCIIYIKIFSDSYWKVHIVTLLSGGTHGCSNHVWCWRWYRLGSHYSLLADKQHQCLYIHNSEHSPQSQKSPSAVCIQRRKWQTHCSELIIPSVLTEVCTTPVQQIHKTGYSQCNSGLKKCIHTHCKQHTRCHSW